MVRFSPNVFTNVVDQSKLKIAPTKEGGLELGSKGDMIEVWRGDETVPVLVRRPPTREKDKLTSRGTSRFDDEPTNTFVPTMLHPPVLCQCHVHVWCHFEVSRNFVCFATILFVDWFGAVCTMMNPEVFHIRYIISSIKQFASP